MKLLRGAGKKKKGGQRLENRPKKTGNDGINFR